MKNLAIFSVSAGAGHVRAAMAIQAFAEKEFPQVKATHVDVMTLVPEMFKKLYTDSYIKIVENHPTFWGYLYKKADREKVDSVLNKVRRAVERLNTRRFEEMLAETKPDYVICTHFLPAEILSRLRSEGTFTAPVYVGVTDFDVHSIWVHKHLSGYFVADEEIAFRLAARGLDPNLIYPTGIPIMPSFSKRLDRATCAAELGLDPKKFTIIMMSGGVGIGGIEILAEGLMKIESDFQIIALAGKNEDLLAKLQALAAQYPKRMFPQGFTKTIERMMSASDLAITKPGGLTTSECLALGLPMIVVSPIPGQEERNADFLLEHGAALKAYDGASLEFRLRSLLKEPKRLEQLCENARRIGKPEAARKILQKVLGA